MVPDDGEEVKDYQEQLKQMLQDLAKEKEKDAEKPLPLMSQVTCCTLGSYDSTEFQTREPLI